MRACWTGWLAGALALAGAALPAVAEAQAQAPSALPAAVADELRHVRDVERHALNAPVGWDPLLRLAPAHKRIEPSCGSLLPPHSTTLNQYFDGAQPRLTLFPHYPARGLLAVGYAGDDFVLTLPTLTLADRRNLRTALAWHIRQIDERSTALARGTVFAVLPGALYLVGVNLGTGAGVAYTVFQLALEEAIGDQEAQRRSQLLELLQRLDDNARVYRTLTRLRHEGVDYIRLQYGLVLGARPYRVTTCYYAEEPTR